jgi:hypothetical protein
MEKKYSPLVLFVGFSVFFGCRLFEVPLRIVSWGGMSVTREGAFASQSGESFLNLDWQAGDDNTPIIAIRMPDGEYIRTDEFRRESLGKYLDSGIAEPVEGWDFAVQYSAATTLVLFDSHGALKRIQISVEKGRSGNAAQVPAIRAAGSDKILSFPLAEDELKEVFGNPSRDDTLTMNT